MTVGFFSAGFLLAFVFTADPPADVRLNVDEIVLAPKELIDRPLRRRIDILPLKPVQKRVFTYLNQSTYFTGCVLLLLFFCHGVLLK